jgi:class 3 adenylate cyclase
VAEPLNNRAWSVALVGRTRSRTALRRWLTESSRGAFRLVAISGPVGIGKSRMLGWAADEHRRRNGLVWLGRCSPELSPPLAPIAGALGDHWPGVTDGGGSSLHVGHSVPQPELDQVQALADVVSRAAAARPVLLALDDVHWADPGTLGVLEQLVYVLGARAPIDCRVSIVITHRVPVSGGHAERVLGRIAREPGFRLLPLEPLDEVETTELIRRLTSSSPDRRLVQQVHEASAGNPLVAIAATDTALSGSHGRPLAQTVDEVMARCLDGLSGPAVQVGLTLAVHSQAARLDQLARMSGVSQTELAAAVDELDLARVVVLTRDLCELVSPHVAEALLAGATKRERHAAHGRLAETLRSRAPGELDVLALAHHLERAGPRYAVELGEVAGDAAERAFAAGAWGWAARLYEAALRDAEPSDPRARAGLEEKAGIACFRDFDTRCEDHLTAAVRLGQAHGDPDLAARAAMWLVRHRLTSGTDAIGRWIDVSPLENVIVGGELPAATRAQAQALLAEVAFQASDLPRARKHVAEARSLAAVAGEEFVGCWVALADGLAHLGLLELDPAAAAFAEADRCRRRSGQNFILPGGANRLALTEVIRGDLDAADRWAATAASDAQEAANWAEHALAHTTRAIVAALHGRFDDMEDHGEVGRVSCGRSANTYTPLVLHPAVAWGRAARRDREGASSALDELDAAGGRSARYRLALELMTDDPDVVRKELARYEWRPPPAALTTYDAGAHAAQLELAIHARDHAAVRAGCSLFEDLHAKGGRFVLEWPSLVPRLIAEAKVCLGQQQEAPGWLDRAAQVAGAAGARVEMARLHVTRARLLLAARDDESVRMAVDLIDSATREFDALGLLRFAHQAQGLFDLPPAAGVVTRRRLRPRTVLFTDIVDSTAWNVRLGDDHWLVLLAEHNRLARREVRHRRGVVVKTTGDGICAWFAETAEAVDCAVALQLAFADFGDAHPETPISIRCGVAVGEVVDFDGDLAGLAVTEAARVCGAAGASQVVTSADVPRADGGTGRRYRSIGSHHLKGLPQAMPLFAVEALRDDRP